MRFQPVKCNMMQITRKQIKKIHASDSLEGTVLENVESIKYLGVTITNETKKCLVSGNPTDPPLIPLTQIFSPHFAFSNSKNRQSP